MSMVANSNSEEVATVKLTEKDLPEVKDWKVGEKYQLILEVEEIGSRQGSMYPMDDENKDNTVHASFKILNAKAGKYRDDIQKGFDAVKD